MVVLHYTAIASAEAAIDWLVRPESQVSAHYLIAKDGEVVSLVPETMRAWHAGAGRWGQVTDVNSHSIGIELDNPGNVPFPADQMAVVEDLLAGIFTRWSIRPERVIGHSDMAPGRKIDPGRLFDWRVLAAAGFSVWPERRGTVPIPTPERFRAMARAFGYTAEVSDRVLLAAVRLRFRPGHDGPLDAADMAIVADLADRFPVDENPAWV